MAINIILAGPRGRMGSEAINMIMHTDHFNLVGCIDRKNDGKVLQDIDPRFPSDAPIFSGAKECFETVDADVLIDLTIPEIGYKNAKLALFHHVRPVVGTSGFTDDQIKELTTIADETKTGCIIAPNFALGAVLMMHFSKIAAKYFPDVEIIEKHHDQKLDAPSGTAVKTLELINEVRESKQQGHPDELETIKGARGGNVAGMRVHSMRLPGLVAHQEVIFGGKSELLTIKHDSFHRESFMEGIRLAVEKVLELDHLVYGLEHILDLN